MSLLANGTRFGRPWPRPVPTRPPLAMPNRPSTIWKLPPNCRPYTSSVKAFSHPSMRRPTCEKTLEATYPPPRIRATPITTQLIRLVAT
ncbi:hypothetical protein D9M72_441610 [compost metagenome]